jgi:glycosyltransferase involved in cell wall biosynthesis
MALEFERHGYEVVYVDRKAKGSSALFASQKIRYYSCPATSSLITDILLSTLFNSIIFFRHIQCSVYYQLKPAPNNSIVAFFAWITGKRLLLDIDDLDYAYFPSGLKHTIYKEIFDRVTKKFPLITYHTPNLKRYIVDNLRVDSSKTLYLAQGVTDTFLAIDISAINKIPKSIIYVATLGITSDLEEVIPLLIEVCKKVPDACVHIVGDGERKKTFEASIESCGLTKQIIFTGRKKHEELPSFIAQHQIGINYMKKTAANECRAILKIREYLACGLQVVCNPTGDTELFSDVLQVETDLISMQKRIVTLLNEPYQVNEKGIALMKHAYNWKVIMDQLVKKCEERW